MTTLPSAPTTLARSLPGRRHDHLFFSGMIALLLATVLLGFAHTYYLAGLFEAPLASRILQIHGAIFSSWMLLLLAQVTLVSAGRVDIHRRLGIAGFFLAGLIVIFGVLAGADSLARLGSRATSPLLSFSITPFTDMLDFGVLAGAALYARANPSAHKRLILMATISLMRAAIFRWPFGFIFHNQIRALLLSYVFVLMLIAYDLWSTHRVQRATAWATLFLVSVHLIRIPVGRTDAWHAVAKWIQSWGI